MTEESKRRVRWLSAVRVYARVYMFGVGLAVGRDMRCILVEFGPFVVFVGPHYRTEE